MYDLQYKLLKEGSLLRGFTEGQLRAREPAVACIWHIWRMHASTPQNLPSMQEPLRYNECIEQANQIEDNSPPVYD